MKKLIYIFLFSFACLGTIQSQCVNSTCSTYVAQPITFTTFPTSGTPLVLGDDQMSSAIPIGFTFQFYCNNYTQAEVSSNGFLTFNLGTFASGCCSGLTIPSSGAPDNYIAAFWNDLYPPGGGTITYTTIGTSPNQIFILTYSGIPHCCAFGPPLNSAQIVLYETTNVIEIHTGQLTNDGSTCTQGIENSTGTSGVASPSLNSTLNTLSNTAYRFTNVTATPPSSITGIASACQNTPVSFTVSGDPSVLSYIWTLPGGWTGTSTTSVMNATVGASGNISVSAVYSCGVSSPTTIVFNTLPLPLISLPSPTPNLICSGNPVTLNGSGAVNYTLEPGGNTNGPPFVVSPMVTTVYTLAGTDANGCVSNNNPTVMVTVNQTPTVTVNSGAVCLGESFTVTPSGATNYTLSSNFSVITPTQVGVITVTCVGTNSTGCISAPALCNVTVNALPNVLATSTRTDICRNESTSLNATGALTYSWNTGATTAGISVTPLSNTSYFVTGTDANNCSKMASINIKVSLCLGVNEDPLQQAKLVNVFPNPSKGEFTIKVLHSVKIEIQDIQGKLIQSLTLTQGEHKIDLSSFAAGEYILKANNQLQNQQVILIKE